MKDFINADFKTKDTTDEEFYNFELSVRRRNVYIARCLIDLIRKRGITVEPSVLRAFDKAIAEDNCILEVIIKSVWAGNVPSLNEEIERLTADSDGVPQVDSDG